MKPKYSEIDWDQMWKIFPEAQAFACDKDETLQWFTEKPKDMNYSWILKVKIGHYIGLYDLEDTDWKDTLVVRPKPKSKMEIFEERIRESRSITCEKVFIIKSMAIAIAKEVFGEV